MAEKTAPVQEAPAEPSPPVARIISTVPREKWIDLDWPVEFDGVLYEKIRIKRITAVELTAYFKKLEDAAAAGGEFPMPPVVDCPLAVWRALDSDDEMKVDDASMDFMPRRLKAAVESSSASGGNTSGS